MYPDVLLIHTFRWWRAGQPPVASDAIGYHHEIHDSLTAGTYSNDVGIGISTMFIHVEKIDSLLCKRT